MERSANALAVSASFPMAQCLVDESVQRRRPLPGRMRDEMALAKQRRQGRCQP